MTTLGSYLARSAAVRPTVQNAINDLFGHGLLMRRVARAVPVLTIVLSACTIGSAGQAAAQPDATPHASTQAAPQAAATASTQADPDASRPPSDGPPTLPAAASGGPGRFPPTARGILDGKVVLVDPGHNGGNFGAPSVINRLIWNGREHETCDTTGAETDGGYTEALFNWHVALDLTADLRAEGATVVLTRTSNTGVGPCVTKRAAIGNAAHANAAVSIHADGGPPGGRGFAILEPVADGINNAIVGPSAILGADLRAAFEKRTREPVSSYDGINGIQPRDDLAGTNLSLIPKVFIECANMRNAADAALVTSPRWQALAARAIAVGLAAFLVRPR
jgi:N-acetylmuramoyl-L-alanine amidase